jgi:hypothetical protein
MRGCVRLDEPTTILVISMEMKPHGSIDKPKDIFVPLKKEFSAV